MTSLEKARRNLILSISRYKRGIYDERAVNYDIDELLKEAIAEHDQGAIRGKALRYKNGDWLGSLHGSWVENEYPMIEFEEDITLESYGELPDDGEVELVNIKITIE
jgi:hypothetical protein